MNRVYGSKARSPTTRRPKQGAAKRGCGKPFPERIVEERGQSTVEFAVVAAGFMSLTVALAALWHAIGDGLLVEHALAVASHHIQLVAPAAVADIFLY